MLDEQDGDAGRVPRSRMMSKMARTISGAPAQRADRRAQAGGAAHQGPRAIARSVLGRRSACRPSGGGARPGAGSARTAARGLPDPGGRPTPRVGDEQEVVEARSGGENAPGFGDLGDAKANHDRSDGRRFLNFVSRAAKAMRPRLMG